MTLEERFTHDNRFRGLVFAIHEGLRAKDYTTDDLHSAIVLAQQMTWDEEAPEEKLRRAVGEARAREVLTRDEAYYHQAIRALSYDNPEYDVDGSILPLPTTPATTEP